MPKDVTKTLRISMTACFSEDQGCEVCKHYDDTKYPECMKELIKDGCAMMMQLYKSNAALRRKVERLEQKNCAKEK